jgi:exopolysaccharide biosynthesis WecB/TagA/CpsF family protein
MPTLPFPTRDILGAAVAVCRRGDAIAWLLERLAHRETTPVAFANANLLTLLARRPGGAKLLDGFLVLNDGVGLDLASRLLHGEPFPDNLNGTDFTPALLQAAPAGTRVFLFGAKPGVAAKAGDAFAARRGVTIAGSRDGYGDAAGAAEAVRAAGADIVLVALGNPRQEEWIAANAATLGAPIVMGVGALFDFAAGLVPRAPAWVQKARLEWVWRAAHEPRRLGRRYSVDLAGFLMLVARQKARMRRADR